MKLQRLLKLEKIVGFLSGVLSAKTLARAALYASQAVHFAVQNAIIQCAPNAKVRAMVRRRIHAVVI